MGKIFSQDPESPVVAFVPCRAYDCDRKQIIFCGGPEVAMLQELGGGVNQPPAGG